MASTGKRMEAFAAGLAVQRLHFSGRSVMDVPDILHRSTLAVLSSKNEGLGICGHRGHGCRFCLHRSDIPALRYVLEGGRSGLLVPGQIPRLSRQPFFSRLVRAGPPQ